MRIIILIVLLLVHGAGIAEDLAAPITEPVETLGGNPVYGQAMPREGVVMTVSQALDGAEALAGAPGKVSGLITEVCQNKGCWLVLAEGERYIRVTFKDYGFFIPTDSQGHALVYGTLKKEEVAPEMANHLAQEGDVRAAKSGGEELRIVAQSIMIKAH